MRQLSVAQQNVLKSKQRATYCLVEIEDAVGNFRNYSLLDGNSFLKEVEYGAGVDEYTSDATVTLKREVYGKSISPLMEDSPLNQVGGIFMPVNDIGRRLRIKTATLPRGAFPSSSDYKVVFSGEVDTFQMGGGPDVKLVCRDKAGRLTDKWIKTKRVYGSDIGVPVVEVMQAMLDDNTGVGVTPLFVIGDNPTFAIKTYEQQNGSLFEAVRNLAMMIGWDVRYIWNDVEDDFVLTLYEPRRNIEVADWLFGPNGTPYIDVKDLTIDKFGVRNDFVGKFISADTGEVITIYDQDINSINKYGEQYMGIFEDENSPINSLPEMEALLASAKADLKDPAAVQTIETLYFWPAEVNDVYDFEPNGKYYDRTQQWAIVSFRHHLGNDGKRRTTFTVRGKPSGGYTNWIRRYGYTNPGIILGPPVITLKYVALLEDQDPVNTIRVQVDVDGMGRSPVRVWYAIGDESYTEEPNIESGDVLTFSREGNDVRSRVLRVRARTPDGMVDEKILIIDWDTVAKIVSINQPYAITANGTQTGWEQPAIVDPDTHSLVIVLTGAVTISTCVPAAVPRAPEDGGGYIIPLGDSLSCVLRYAHTTPGTKGKVSVTPFGGPNGNGASGEGVTFDLERKPEPNIQIQELTSITRRAVITVNPGDSKINWQARLASGSLRPTKRDTESAQVIGWRPSSVVGPTVTFTFDVDPNEDTIIEYYAEGNGMRSATRFQPVDKDNQPEIKDFRAIEVEAGVVKVSGTPDDDCSWWMLWGSPVAFPRKSNGEPDPSCLLFEGNQQDTETPPFGAQEATWYFIARAFDYAGKYREHEFILLVSGAPDPVGSLTITSAVTAEPVPDEFYHRISWTHNEAAETDHKVRILVDGEEVVSLAANRSPEVDYDGTDTLGGIGGYQSVRRYPVLSSHPRAVYKTYTYTIQMYDETDTLVDSDSTNISGYYDSAPTDPEYETPTELPEELFALSNILSIDCSWVNTSSEWYIDIQMRLLYGGVTSENPYFETLDPGEVEHHPSIPAYRQASFRLRYRNVEEVGDWTEWSNWAYSSGAEGEFEG